jgi:hypothetical protein
VNKLYNDRNLPNNKKWTIYVPKEQYIDLKKHSLLSEENINENISEALSIYIQLLPLLKTLRKDATSKNLPLKEHILNIISEHQE